MVMMLLESWRYPEELRSLYLLKKQRSGKRKEKRSIKDLAGILDNKSFCYAVLEKVSRSFAAVIQQLPEDLRDSVCIFYLVLRGLDSIEDDTTTPSETRRQLLETFHEVHKNPDWSVKGIGDSKDYQQLLENYQHVIRTFQGLPAAHQHIILDICQQMGQGMCKYLDQELDLVDDYDEYCGYVAGLVGVGLSKLFSASGLESEQVAKNEQLSNSMGLFLQKTNIIRDFHEDLVAERTFWPREVWNKYSNNLTTLADSNGGAMECLNELVTDALRHTVDCLSYLKTICDPRVFQFCAIPQVMAIATLSEVYNNPKVFSKNVKIRKGLTAKLILQTRNYEDAREIFEHFAISIFNKIPVDDPHGPVTAAHLRSLINNQSKIREIDLFSKHRSMNEKHAMAS